MFDVRVCNLLLMLYSILVGNNHCEVQIKKLVAACITLLFLVQTQEPKVLSFLAISLNLTLHNFSF